MAKVHLPLQVARTFANGVTEHYINAGDIRHVMLCLEQMFPGIGDQLGRGMAVAIDGEIYQDWFLEEVGSNSEVRFLPAIEGG